MKDFKYQIDRRYGWAGGYDQLVKFLSDGMSYSHIAQHFKVDKNTVFRWNQRIAKRLDGIYTIKEGQ